MLAFRDQASDAPAPAGVSCGSRARRYRASSRYPSASAVALDAGRHAIAEAVFERIDVLGVTDYTFTLTAHVKARGWDAAFRADATISNGQFGRGERDSPATNDLPITMRLSEPPALVELVRSA